MHINRFALKLIVLATISFACTLVGAQSRYFMSVQDTKKGAEGVVASLGAGNQGSAIKELRLMTILAPQQFDLFEAQFNSQEIEILRRFGEPLDYELLRSDELGGRLVRHQFLVNYSHAPIRWTFVFFRSPKGWTLNDFRFDGVSLDFFNSPAGQLRSQ